MKAYDLFAVINKIIVGVVVWMLIGFGFIVFYGFPGNYPQSPLSWLFWCAAATPRAARAAVAKPKCPCAGHRKISDFFECQKVGVGLLQLDEGPPHNEIYPL